MSPLRILIITVIAILLSLMLYRQRNSVKNGHELITLMTGHFSNAMLSERIPIPLGAPYKYVYLTCIP